MKYKDFSMSEPDKPVQDKTNKITCVPSKDSD